MKYNNPVLSGFYPDPSVTTDGKKFYLVTSTFQYFPGVALFESDDLVNWTQIGHVLTRESQLPLDNAFRSEGIFAPTIRYNKHNGRFYMITTNVSMGGNFLVYTDDIYGEWSEPVLVKQQGIDPSLLFDEDGSCYFCGNGTDENGRSGVFVAKIIPETGEALEKAVCVWHGNGGRFLEAPHIYHIGEYYYMMAAEGGTEYGHMEVYGRGTSPYGPFENYSGNPILTNRNLGGYEVQGVGHADLVQDFRDGNWYLVHLAFRQTGLYMTYHVTGRETYLVPVTFDEQGWFTAGVHEPYREEGLTRLEMEAPIKLQRPQVLDTHQTFANTKPGREWIYVRRPLGAENLEYTDAKVVLTGTEDSIDDTYGNPAVIFIRQKEHYGHTRVKVTALEGTAGLTVYMDEQDHYDLFVRKKESGCEAVFRIRLGQAVCEKMSIPLSGNTAELEIVPDLVNYHFYIMDGDKRISVGSAESKYLSTESCGGFVGVLFGLYAQPSSKAEFTGFDAVMKRNKESD